MRGGLRFLVAVASVVFTGAGCGVERGEGDAAASASSTDQQSSPSSIAGQADSASPSTASVPVEDPADTPLEAVLSGACLLMPEEVQRTLNDELARASDEQDYDFGQVEIETVSPVEVPNSPAEVCQYRGVHVGGDGDGRPLRVDMKVDDRYLNRLDSWIRAAESGDEGGFYVYAVSSDGKVAVRNGEGRAIVRDGTSLLETELLVPSFMNRTEFSGDPLDLSEANRVQSDVENSLAIELTMAAAAAQP